MELFFNFGLLLSISIVNRTVIVVFKTKDSYRNAKVKARCESL